jgi:hypothetical protein
VCQYGYRDQRVKKTLHLQSVNQKLLSQLQPEQVEVVVEPIEANEETAIEESSLDAPMELRR